MPPGQPLAIFICSHATPADRRRIAPPLMVTTTRRLNATPDAAHFSSHIYWPILFHTAAHFATSDDIILAETEPSHYGRINICHFSSTEPRCRCRSMPFTPLPPR
jgi:hypothetical protein